MFVLKNTKISILTMKLGKVTLLYIVSYIDRFEFSTHLDNLADNTKKVLFSDCYIKTQILVLQGFSVTLSDCRFFNFLSLFFFSEMKLSPFSHVLLLLLLLSVIFPATVQTVCISSSGFSTPTLVYK